MEKRKLTQEEKIQRLLFHFGYGRHDYRRAGYKIKNHSQVGYYKKDKTFEKAMNTISKLGISDLDLVKVPVRKFHVLASGKDYSFVELYTDELLIWKHDSPSGLKLPDSFYEWSPNWLTLKGIEEDAVIQNHLIGTLFHSAYKEEEKGQHPHKNQYLYFVVLKTGEDYILYSGCEGEFELTCSSASEINKENEKIRFFWYDDCNNEHELTIEMHPSSEKEGLYVYEPGYVCKDKLRFATKKINNVIINNDAKIANYDTND